jgi:hypothetical protein
MSRFELDSALGRIADLWAEIDASPRPETDRRERIVKQAVNLLQQVADEFDVRRSSKSH